MQRVFLDIETIPTQDPWLAAAVAGWVKPPAQMTKAETIAKWEATEKAEAIMKAVRDTSLDGLFGEIYCIGCAIDSQAVSVFGREDLTSDAEIRVLRQFFDFVANNTAGQEPVQWVGHYVLDFDLPFLWRRCVVLRERPPIRLPHDAKPWSGEVADTRLLWGGGDPRQHVSLEKLCLALGIHGKGDVDGSKVWDLVMAGEHERVIEYCRADVERARAIYRRLIFEKVER